MNITTPQSHFALAAASPLFVAANVWPGQPAIAASLWLVYSVGSLTIQLFSSQPQDGGLAHLHSNSGYDTSTSGLFDIATAETLVSSCTTNKDASSVTTDQPAITSQRRFDGCRSTIAWLSSCTPGTAAPSTEPAIVVSPAEPNADKGLLDIFCDFRAWNSFYTSVATSISECDVLQRYWSTIADFCEHFLAFFYQSIYPTVDDLRGYILISCTIALLAYLVPKVIKLWKHRQAAAQRLRTFTISFLNGDLLGRLIWSLDAPRLDATRALVVCIAIIWAVLPPAKSFNRLVLKEIQFNLGSAVGTDSYVSSSLKTVVENFLFSAISLSEEYVTKSLNSLVPLKEHIFSTFHQAFRGVSWISKVVFQQCGIAISDLIDEVSSTRHLAELIFIFTAVLIIILLYRKGVFDTLLKNVDLFINNTSMILSQYAFYAWAEMFFGCLWAVLKWAFLNAILPIGRASFAIAKVLLGYHDPLKLNEAEKSQYDKIMAEAERQYAEEKRKTEQSQTEQSQAPQSQSRKSSPKPLDLLFSNLGPDAQVQPSELLGRRHAKEDQEEELREQQEDGESREQIDATIAERAREAEVKRMEQVARETGQQEEEIRQAKEKEILQAAQDEARRLAEAEALKAAEREAAEREAALAEIEQIVEEDACQAEEDEALRVEQETLQADLEALRADEEELNQILDEEARQIAEEEPNHESVGDSLPQADELLEEIWTEQMERAVGAESVSPIVSPFPDDAQEISYALPSATATPLQLQVSPSGGFSSPMAGQSVPSSPLTPTRSHRSAKSKLTSEHDLRKTRGGRVSKPERVIDANDLARRRIQFLESPRASPTGGSSDWGTHSPRSFVAESPVPGTPVSGIPAPFGTPDISTGGVVKSENYPTFDALIQSRKQQQQNQAESPAPFPVVQSPSFDSGASQSNQQADQHRATPASPFPPSSNPEKPKPRTADDDGDDSSDISSLGDPHDMSMLLPVAQEEHPNSSFEENNSEYTVPEHPYGDLEMSDPPVQDSDDDMTDLQETGEGAFSDSHNLPIKSSNFQDQPFQSAPQPDEDEMLVSPEYGPGDHFSSNLDQSTVYTGAQDMPPQDAPSTFGDIEMEISPTYPDASRQYTQQTFAVHNLPHPDASTIVSAFEKPRADFFGKATGRAVEDAVGPSAQDMDLGDLPDRAGPAGPSYMSAFDKPREDIFGNTAGRKFEDEMLQSSDQGFVETAAQGNNLGGWPNHAGSDVPSTLSPFDKPRLDIFGNSPSTQLQNNNAQLSWLGTAGPASPATSGYDMFSKAGPASSSQASPSTRTPMAAFGGSPRKIINTQVSDEQDAQISDAAASASLMGIFGNPDLPEHATSGPDSQGVNLSGPTNPTTSTVSSGNGNAGEFFGTSGDQGVAPDTEDALAAPESPGSAVDDIPSSDMSMSPGEIAKMNAAFPPPAPGSAPPAPESALPDSTAASPLPSPAPTSQPATPNSTAQPEKISLSEFFGRRRKKGPSTPSADGAIYPGSIISESPPVTAGPSTPSTVMTPPAQTATRTRPLLPIQNTAVLTKAKHVEEDRARKIASRPKALPKGTRGRRASGYGDASPTTPQTPMPIIPEAFMTSLKGKEPVVEKDPDNFDDWEEEPALEQVYGFTEMKARKVMEGNATKNNSEKATEEGASGQASEQAPGEASEQDLGQDSEQALEQTFEQTPEQASEVEILRGSYEDSEGEESKEI